MGAFYSRIKQLFSCCCGSCFCHSSCCTDDEVFDAEVKFDNPKQDKDTSIACSDCCTFRRVVTNSDKKVSQ